MIGRYRDGRVNDPCFTCGHARLPVIAIALSGVPHHAEDHHFTHEYSHLSACDTCDDGELLTFSHDCFAYYGDDPWNMSWTWHLDRADLGRLRTALADCPDPYDYQCDCATHESLRRSKNLLPDGRAESLSIALTSDGAAEFILAP